MADQIVGIDFGTRSIKLVVIDQSSDPVVTAFDEEPIPLDRDPYVESEGFEEEPEKPPEQEQEPEATSAGAGDQKAREASGESTDGTGGPPEAPDDAMETGELEDTNEWETGLDREFHWVDALDDLIARQSLEDATEFVTYLPEGRAISIHEDVPFYEPSNIRDILPNLLEDRLPIEPEQIIYDFRVVTPEDAEQHTAVIGLARKSDIGDFLDRLVDRDVNPAVLGIPELMLRYAAEAAAPSDETAAIVDIGHQFSRVIVLDDGAPVLARSLEVGGEAINRRIAEKLNLSREQAESHKIENGTAKPAGATNNRQERATSEAVRVALRPLVRDLRRNFQSLYAQDGIELESIYLCGGTSRLDSIDQYLADQFGIDVEPLRLENAIDYGIVADAGAPESALALACALQMVHDRAEERLLDLRKGEYAYRGRSTYIRAQMKKFGAAAAVLLMLFFGTLFARQYELQQRKQALKQGVADQTREVFGKAVTDPTVVEKIATGQSSTKRAFVPQMSAYQLYFELMSRISDDIEVELQRIDVDTDRNIVQMSGTTTDPQTVDSLVTDLKGLTCIKDVNKKPVRVRSEDEARFELEISSGCS